MRWANKGRMFTDWAEGPPPCEGVWRIKMNYFKDEGLYCRWWKGHWRVPSRNPNVAAHSECIGGYFDAGHAKVQWFGIAHKTDTFVRGRPDRIGMHRVRLQLLGWLDPHEAWQYWNGDYWGVWSFSKGAAYRDRDIESAESQDPYWDYTYKEE